MYIGVVKLKVKYYKKPLINFASANVNKNNSIISIYNLYQIMNTEYNRGLSRDTPMQIYIKLKCLNRVFLKLHNFLYHRTKIEKRVFNRWQFLNFISF